jgi:hypothetical protein
MFDHTVDEKGRANISNFRNRIKGISSPAPLQISDASILFFPPLLNKSYNSMKKIYQGSTIHGKKRLIVAPAIASRPVFEDGTLVAAFSFQHKEQRPGKKGLGVRG